MEDGNIKGPGENIDAMLQRIFSNRGFDIRGYKMPILQRRISRRMDVLGVSGLSEYAEYIEADPDEYKILFNTILANVSHFFRDPEAWNFIRKDVVPEILGKAEDIRIWSAGCANGAEPYSVAITLAEILGGDLSRHKIKIYATDIDESAIKLARNGTYTIDQLGGVTEEIRSKYFTAHDDVYTISGKIRDMLIFSRHDLILDPPMPNIDLLLCRNVLIYLNREFQSKVIPNLHYSIRDNGHLWLGRAETLTTKTDEFRLLNAQWRIFKKIPSTTRSQPAISDQSDKYTKAEIIDTNRRLEQLIQSIQLGFIMLDENLNVVMCNKIARDIWGLLPDQILGRQFFDLEISYRPVSLKGRIENAVASGESSVIDNAEYWITKDRQIYLKIEIVPIDSGVTILVEDITAQYEMKKELQVTITSLETSNERLLTANEELRNENRESQSINEELQCTNEEIEAANQELKATNEELRARIAELSNMKRYMKWP